MRNPSVYLIIQQFAIPDKCEIDALRPPTGGICRGCCCWWELVSLSKNGLDVTLNNLLLLAKRILRLLNQKHLLLRVCCNGRYGSLCALSCHGLLKWRMWLSRDNLNFPKTLTPTNHFKPSSTCFLRLLILTKTNKLWNTNKNKFNIIKSNNEL